MTTIEQTTTAAEYEISAAVPERWRLGDWYVPASRYLDVDYLELEIEHIFGRTWVVACREQELREIGSYVEISLVDQPIVVVRDSDTSIKAYHNACRHRGTRLVTGRGRIGGFRCPFHAWQWALNGESRYVRDPQDFKGSLNSDALCLRQCHVDAWGGWVFVNTAESPPPLAEYLDPIQRWLDPFQLDRMSYRWMKTTILPCNWKTALDAFSEGYHVPGTHPQLLRPMDHNMRPASRSELENDPSFAPSRIMGTHISRFRSESRNLDGENARYASPEALLSNVEYQVRELRALYTELEAEAAREIVRDGVPEGQTPNSALRAAQRRLAKEEGYELPEVTPEVRRIGEGNFKIFPNTIFLVRDGCLLGYRSFPNGNDPDSCIFDAYACDIYPEGKEPKFEPQFDEDWEKLDVGEVLAQDFRNVNEVRAGIHSRSFQGSTLNPVQEQVVFHHHLVADRYLFG